MYEWSFCLVVNLWKSELELKRKERGMGWSFILFGKKYKARDSMFIILSISRICGVFKEQVGVCTRWRVSYDPNTFFLEAKKR